MLLARVLRLPFLVILAGVGVLAMLPPGLFAWFTRDWYSARAFLYSAILFGVLLVLVAIATSARPASHAARSHLLALVAAFALLPAMLALPVYEAVHLLPYSVAYYEMVSNLTTTGARFLPESYWIPDAVHMYRALVGWLGGFLVWVMALAILSPMNLGGFEVTSRAQFTQSSGHLFRISDPAARLARFTKLLLPIYSGLTLTLWLLLILAGETPLVALCHAMSTLATSGISPLNDLSESNSAVLGEGFIFFFFFFAISRRAFSTELAGEFWPRLRDDPEFRIGLICVVTLPLLLFFRHWLAAIEGDTEEETVLAIEALWGGIFTTLSFLSTTGFESASWESAREWSGLKTPGIILVGLALVGGGVATTAGGVKLLRVFALYMHGRRELDRLVHPSSVGGSGVEARRIRREGAYIAWIFFMLFALSIAVIMAGLSFVGVSFENATVLAVATLSTTGPLATTVTDGITSYATLPSAAKPILAAAMVVGRLETLAIIALFNPAFWRG